LDYMQAIFLLEYFSHFKAKRVARALSEIFQELYDKLWKKHYDAPRSRFEQLATIPSQAGEEEIQLKWTQWIHQHAFERLLTACYILESQQALLLVRRNQTPSTSGLELYIPAQSAAWEATTCFQWRHLMRASSDPIIDVEEALDSIAKKNPHHAQYEPFQCALITACHAASVVYQKQETEHDPYGLPSTPSHPLFQGEKVSAIEDILCTHSNARIMHHAVVMASATPFRALLATSGESWVLSERLSHEALLAAAQFATLKNELHTWVDDLQPPAFLWTRSTGANGAHLALQQALSILELALDTDNTNLAFGPEMALYYASLVLWAATHAAIVKAEANGIKFETDDTAEFEAPEAEKHARSFITLAKADLTSLVGNGIPSSDGVHTWRVGVGAVLRWSSWIIGGAELRSSGVGELMEGAICALEKLGQRGWVGEWF
jgi:hypothetical protein